jgi:arginine N-succinyltransferase
LFPDEVYATLLSDAAQNVIGEVGEQTRGVEKLLRRIGFHYAERVDPFDGGPHFLASTDAVSLVQRSQEAELEVHAEGPREGSAALAARDTIEHPYFVAVPAQRLPDGRVSVSAASAARLGAGPGDRVWVLPLG